MASRKRSIAKSITWRIQSVVVGFSTSYLVLGEVKLAGTLTLIQASVGLVMYYLHERLWHLLVTLLLAVMLTGCGKVEHSGEVVVRLDPRIEAYFRAKCEDEVPAELVEDCVNAAMAEFLGAL